MVWLPPYAVLLECVSALVVIVSTHKAFLSLLPSRFLSSSSSSSSSPLFVVRPLPKSSRSVYFSFLFLSNWFIALDLSVNHTLEQSILLNYSAIASLLALWSPFTLRQLHLSLTLETESSQQQNAHSADR